MVAMSRMNIVFADIMIKTIIFFYSTGIVLINITCIFLANIKACLVYNTCPIDYYTYLINQLDNNLLIIPGSQHLSRWSPEFRRPRAELPAQ